MSECRAVDFTAATPGTAVASPYPARPAGSEAAMPAVEACSGHGPGVQGDEDEIKEEEQMPPRSGSVAVGGWPDVGLVDQAGSSRADNFDDEEDATREDHQTLTADPYIQHGQATAYSHGQFHSPYFDTVSTGADPGICVMGQLFDRF